LRKNLVNWAAPPAVDAGGGERDKRRQVPMGVRNCHGTGMIGASHSWTSNTGWSWSWPWRGDNAPRSKFMSIRLLN